MSDSDKYTPLSERVQQDVWHDNFVPKYSALASAQPSSLVLIGVWLIFVPMALGAFAMTLATIADSPDLITAVISSIGSTLFCMLAVAILYTQTRRFRAAILQPNNECDDDDADKTSEHGVNADANST